MAFIARAPPGERPQSAPYCLRADPRLEHHQGPTLPSEGMSVFASILRINASTRADRVEMTALAERAILDSGGWILDFKQFSNVSVCINFEIPAKNVERLRQALKATDLRLTGESDDALASHSGPQDRPRAESKEADVSGTLQITFIHDEPDLRRHIPAIPG